MSSTAPATSAIADELSRIFELQRANQWNVKAGTAAERKAKLSKLKAAVEAGRFGRLTLGETTCKWWRPQSYYDEGGWKGTKALDGGGALMNQAIHNVDLLLWMMGPATHVTGFTATLAHEHIEVEDTAVACLRFANGALGVIQATTSVHPGLPKTIGVHGDWGAGKSSVLEMVEAAFPDGGEVLCLKFSGWQFQGFEDAKIALSEKRRSDIPMEWVAPGLSAAVGRPDLVGHTRQLATRIAAR